MSFLTAPQSETQATQAANAVAAGFKAGEAENEQNVSNAASAEQDARDTAAKSILAAQRTKEEAAKDATDRTRAISDEAYEDDYNKLNGSLTALDTLLNAPHTDKTTPEYAGAVRARADLAGRIQNLQNIQKGNLTGTADFSPATSGAPEAPPMLPLDAMGQQIQQSQDAVDASKGAQAIANVQKTERENNTPTKVPPTKIAPNYQASAFKFSGNQSMLAGRANYVAGLKASADANPNDQNAQNAYAKANANLQALQDATSSSYSQTANGLAMGAYGGDVQSAYNDLVASLPKGTDPTDIANHASLRAALRSAARSKGTLTPAQQELSGYLRLDQDLPAMWGSQTSGDPMQVERTKAAIDAEMNDGAPTRPFLPSAPLVPSAPPVSTPQATPPPLMPYTGGTQ